MFSRKVSKNRKREEVIVDYQTKGCSSGVYPEDNNNQEEDDKVIHSNFMVTVNSNLRYEAEDGDDMALLRKHEKMLREATNFMLTKEEFPKFVLIRKPGHSWEENIIRVRTDANTQVGSINRRLHMHIAVCIDHTTNVQMDVPNLKQYFKDILGLSYPPHVDAKYHKGNRDPYEIMQMYIRKGE